MKLFLGVSVLLLLLSADYAEGFRRRRCPNDQRLPRNIMSLAYFRQMIVDEGYTALYFLPALSLPPDLAKYQYSMVYKQAGGGTGSFNQTVVFRDKTDMTTNPCNVDFRTFEVADHSTSPRAALKRVDIDNGFTFYYFSTRPKVYLLEVGCTDPVPRRDCCEGDYRIVLFMNRNPPDGFPWGCADSEMYKETGISMDRSDFLYTFSLNDCPNGLK